MSEPRILRIPLAGSGNSRDGTTFVLLRISGHASPSLDLDILGTDELHPYKTKLRQASLQQCLVKGALKNDEWTAVLAWIFFAQKPDPQFDELVQQVELVANVVDGKEITLVLRQMVSGIMKRLGSITLNCDESEEISLFDWAGIAADSVTKSQTASRELQKHIDVQQETIKKLKAQLEDLIQAKQEEEKALLNKFRQLLNAKKAKIRDQMRLLSAARVDSSAAHESHNTRSITRSITRSGMQQGGARKRMASKTPEADDVADRETETAEVDGQNNQSDSEDAFERAQTPGRSDDDLDATGDEIDSVLSRNKLSKKRGTGVSTRREDATRTDSSSEMPEQPPPRRELPFTSTEQSQTKQSREEETRLDNHDSDETDDEL